MTPPKSVWATFASLPLIWAVLAAPLHAQTEYLLVPGDILKISVFKNPDLTTDAKVSEAGTIGMPLLGSVPVQGLSIPAAEHKIAQLLKDGSFVLNAQVTILLSQAVGSQITVLGQVNRPGRYPVDEAGGHVSGVLAAAGGIAPTGSDIVIVTGTRAGKPFRREIDMVKMSLNGNAGDDITLAGGDTLFVNRAPLFYIYGQVQHPGEFRLERRMTLMQALAAGGGVTGKGTARGIVVHRRDANGKVKELDLSLDDDMQDEDVIYVKESLF
jgi:polysaccharide export outer membrane protein